MIAIGKAKLVSAIFLASTGVTAGACYSFSLFKSKGQRINELIKIENKHVLLSLTASEDTTGWTASWEKYQKNKVWGEIENATSDQVPKKLKEICKEKIANTVYSNEDIEYSNVTNFCARDKLIEDVLKEEGGFTLLTGSGKEEKWKERFENYKKSENTIRLSNVTIADSDTKEKNHNKISEGCASAIKLKTTDSNYQSNLVAIKRWCNRD